MKHTRNTTGRGPRGKTTNYEGAEAFELDDEGTLVNLVSTCMMNEPRFYGEKGDVETQIHEVCKKVNSKFILQLANYARNELYLRSVSMYLLAIGANLPATKPYVREYTPHIVNRADELYESLACYISIFGKPIPNSLKKGIVASFPKFDEYQFAKYNRKTDVNLKDVIRLTHPTVPSELIRKILDDKLKTPDTWEVKSSKKGNTPKMWESLILANKLPYMATLRNLRNLLTCGGKGVSDTVLDKVIAYIRNPNAVRKSKQFPFRFFTAYMTLSGERQPSRNMMVTWDRGGEQFERIDHPRTGEVLDALEEAIAISYENIPHMKGTTVLAADVSGSMQSPVSEKSILERFDIGILLASATNKYTDKAYTGMFGDTFKVVPLVKKSAGIITSCLEMHRREGEVGYSTNGHKVIEYFLEHKIPVDRFLIFTDCQLWDSDNVGGLFNYRVQDLSKDSTINKKWQEYKRTVNKNARMYLFNLADYGTVNFPSTDRSVTNINGWSDKVLNFIEQNEADPKAQVNYIKNNY